MPQKIIIIRHGETDYNKDRRIQGWLDIPLNEVGHKQAKQASLLVAKHKIDALYSSDLARAHQTALHIATAIKLEVKLAPQLRERDMGIFAGWAWEAEKDAKKEKLWLEFESARDQNQRNWNKHQGESIGEMADRIAQFIQTVHDLHASQTVALVTHGGTANRILEHFGLKQNSTGFHPIKNAHPIVLLKESESYKVIEGL